MKIRANKLFTQLGEYEAQKNKIKQSWIHEESKITEVKEVIRKWKSEIEEIKSTVVALDEKLDEYKHHIDNLQKNIGEKLESAKKSIKDLKQIASADMFMTNRIINQREEVYEEDLQNEESKSQNNQEDQDMEVDENQEDQVEDDQMDDDQNDGSNKRSKRAKGIIFTYFLNPEISYKELQLTYQQCEELYEQNQEIAASLKEAENELESLDVNISVIDEFKRQIKLFKNSDKVTQKLKAKEQDALNQLEDVKKEKYEKFMKGFNEIKWNLKEMYRSITNDGDAELELKDSLDPFMEGVIFTVRPPKKSWKQISNLSGGEKTLASLSLIFALHYYKPTPVYCMDEIDAALDYKNVSIVADYVKNQACRAQFIVISLRQNMFEKSDKMVGIYKIHDVTRTLCIAPRLFEEKIKREKESKDISMKND